MCGMHVAGASSAPHASPCLQSRRQSRMAGSRKAPQKLHGRSGRPCTSHSIMTTRGVQVASHPHHTQVSRGHAASTTCMCGQLCGYHPCAQGCGSYEPASKPGSPASLSTNKCNDPPCALASLVKSCHDAGWLLCAPLKQADRQNGTLTTKHPKNPQQSTARC